MSDKGKAEAIEALRREVGFGCPIPGCRSPFLTWHHFDPPWHIEEHWRPEGMIALCLEHHPNADPQGVGGNAYSPAELRALKKSKHSAEDVRARFPSWQKKNLLIRMGGCYTTPSMPLLSVSGIPQIGLRQDEAGLLALSFQLRNKDDSVLVEMVDNWFTAYPSNIHDMTVTPKTRQVKVWLDTEDVGLDLSFRRITMDELREIMNKDAKRTLAEMRERDERRIEEAPLEKRQSMRMELEQRMQRYEHDDFVASRVQEWAHQQCRMDDGLIPFLNFEQLAIHLHGHRLVIKDGMGGQFDYCARINSRDSYNLECPCPDCIGTGMSM